MKPRRPKKPFKFTLPADIRNLLEERGAHGDRTHGPHGYTAQFLLTFSLSCSALTHSDPRETRGWTEPFYSQILKGIPNPEVLDQFHIARLGDYIGAQPTFLELAKNLHLEPKLLVETLNGLSFAEKSHLVDAATARQADLRGRAGARRRRSVPVARAKTALPGRRTGKR